MKKKSFLAREPSLDRCDLAIRQQRYCTIVCHARIQNTSTFLLTFQYLDGMSSMFIYLLFFGFLVLDQ